MIREVSEAFHAEIHESGYVPNLLRLRAWRRDVQVAFEDLRKLVTSGSSLSPRDVAVVFRATASTLRDSYCSIAWGARLTRTLGPGHRRGGASSRAGDRAERSGDLRNHGLHRFPVGLLDRE